jgi:hypothetical protein
MNRTRANLIVLLISACAAWPAAQAQDAQTDDASQAPQPSRRQRGDRAQRQNRGPRRGPNARQNRARPDSPPGFGPGPGPGFGPGGFGRGGLGRGFGRGSGGPSQFTPEQREQFYNRYIDRQLSRLTRTYELDDTQRQQVQQQLQALRDEDRATADQRMQQMAAARQQLRQLREQSDAGQQVSPEQWQQATDQMRNVFRSSPLMNRERTTAAVEQFLSPEQIATGRQRLQQEEAERDRRRQEMRQQFEQFVQQGGDPREFFRQQRGQRQRRQNQNQPQDTTGQSQNTTAQPPDTAAQSEAAPAGPDEPATLQNAPGEQNTEDQGRREDNRERRRRFRRDQAEETTEDPLGSWERYVRDFTRRYRLDTSQQATAQSVLRDALAQRKLFEDSHRTDIAFAQQIEDPARRQRQIDSINAPIARLFEQLKTKLERLPTADQREAVEGKRPTSRPSAGTQPAAGG